MIALFLTGPPAHAQGSGGSYAIKTDASGKVIGYTGGKFVPTKNGTPATGNPYIWNPNDGGTPYYGGVGTASGMAGDAVSVTGSGSLSATFVWSPTGMPTPSAVVIHQQCTVYGFPGGPFNGFSVSGDAGMGTGLSADKYTAVTNPSASFSIPTADGLSPTVTAGGTIAPGGGSAGVHVAYTATATPVTINLTGTTPDASGNANILVGQGCTASISGLPAGTGWKTTYQWSANGQTFQSWNGDSGNVPVVAILGLGTTNQATAHWFWSDTAGPKSVACTAIITPPAGQGSQFKVTVKKSVTLQVPNWKANNYVGAGYIGIDNGVTSIFAGPTSIIFGQGYTNGSNWKGFVPIPPDFTGTGQWQYAQIVSPGEFETPVGGTQKQSTQTGLTGLDDMFPYGVLHDTGGSPQTDVDSPNFAVLDTYAAVTLDDAFATYLMFQPPLAPSATTSGPQWVQWVCLAESSWNTGFSASRPGSGLWKDFPATQTIGVVGLIHDFQSFTTHPHWAIRITNTTVFP